MGRFVTRLQSALDSVKELVIIYLIMVSIVAILFSLFEGRDILTSYYWTFITGLTIGYGDISPITGAGRTLAILYAHIMVFLYIPIAVGYVVVNMIKNKDAWTDDEQREMMEILRELRSRKKKEKKKAK